MTPVATIRAATAIVAVIGALWGTYWIPVRALDGLGLPGAWGTLTITGLAALVLAPFAPRLRTADRAAIAAIALGGAAFTLYSVAFLYGRVSITVLMFFLTPVWSTILARLIGWETPLLRYLAIAVGLLGLAVITGAVTGTRLALGLGEWMGLASGLLWAVSSVAVRARAPVQAAPAAFVFAAGGALAALALAPLLAPLPETPALAALGLAALTGVLWWGIFTVGLMWAVTRLDPARTGILLMGEVLVGTATAAWLAGEILSAPELLGGALVLLAGVLEVWPVRQRGRALH